MATYYQKEGKVVQKSKSNIKTKIAIPVKTNRDNPVVSPLFGKAKWFAFVQDGNISVEKNQCEGGREVIEWLVSQNINVIIFQEMGTRPYEMIKRVGGIKLFHSGTKRVLLNDILDRFNSQDLIELNEEKISDIIRHHEGSHSHEGHHHH